MAHRFGVCSWSLQPENPRDLVEKVRATGLSAVQLALDPLGEPAWPVEETLACLRDAGIAILSGMMRTRGEDYSTLESIRRTGGVRQDAHWEWNLANARRIADLAAGPVGVPLVTFHAGFLPPGMGDPLRRVMVERLRAVIDVFAAKGVRVGFETGQETAATLTDVLGELNRPTAGVNFDPANMILYDHGDPVESLRILAPRVVQVHIKDAVRTRVPGQWGSEVAVGAGEVAWPAFLDALCDAGLQCDLLIEREAGGRRVDEIRAAHEHVRLLLKSRDVGGSSREIQR
ncbi:MAG: sugar phosphate isomerase/epimerase [Planctomycetes bacterium]|nr:sugar phosphate isomerase/epimerase [Planctomycetota bacterium]